MKNKKTFIVLALLIAVLMLGIGYAAITAVPLSIDGSASSGADKKNFVVEFTNAAPATGDTFVVADETTVNNPATTATMTVKGLTAKGDTATATFTVQNKSEDLSAVIKNVKAQLTEAGTTAAETANFKITTTLAEDTTLVAKTGEVTFTVSVELLNTPIEDTDASTATISVTFDATPVQPSA